MTKLARRGKPIDLWRRNIHPDFLAVGTVKDWARPDYNHQEATVYRPSENHLAGNFHSTRNSKIPPEGVIFDNPGDEPNFNHALEIHTMETFLYGDILLEVFPSFDRNYRFMFCSDAKGKAWIGGIENSSSISPIGVRKSFVNAGDLTTPPWEYYSDEDPDDDFTGGYGNYDKRLGNYADMFDYYLSRIPVIERYLWERGRLNRASLFFRALKDKLDL